jgi:hypothetical protein
MSKGDRFRAKTVSLQEFDNSFEGIFGVKTPKPRYVPPPLPEELQNLESAHEKLLGKDVPHGRT